MSVSDTIESLDLEIIPFEENDDPDLRTHIVVGVDNLHIWRSGMSSRDVVDMARMMGVEVKALCGYVFIPKHNPERFNSCEGCLRMASGL